MSRGGLEDVGYCTDIMNVEVQNLDPADSSLFNVVATSNETSIQKIFEIPQEDAEQVGVLVGGLESGNFRCLICELVSSDPNHISAHILLDHKDSWKSKYQETLTNTAPSTGDVFRNIFENQDWKKNLNSNFYNRVIKKCAEMTRDAWRNQTVFAEHETDKFIRVGTDIIQKLVDEILEIYGKAPTPTEADLREVIRDNLTVNYPHMFGDNAQEVGRPKLLRTGYGRGGYQGLKNLPKQLKSRIHTQQLKLRKVELDLNNEGGNEIPTEAVTKGRNRKKRYGN